MAEAATQTPPSAFQSYIQDRIFRAVTFAHVSIYRLSGGKIWGTMMNVPILLLGNTGRKTGKRRITPLMYLPDGRNMVIVASKGGAPKDPAWWVNLKAKPTTKVQVGDQALTVKARQANAEERTALWPRLVELYPSYADYQKLTTREIPVIILEPLA